MASNFKIDIDIKSLDKLVNNLQKKLPEVAKDVVETGCMQIERDAKINCPVDTGRLRDSIHTTIEESNQSGTEGAVGTNVEYAPYVELGTSRQAPQPYMKPAMDENREAIIGYAKAKVKEAIERSK